MCITFFFWKLEQKFNVMARKWNYLAFSNGFSSHNLLLMLSQKIIFDIVAFPGLLSYLVRKKEKEISKCSPKEKVTIFLKKSWLWRPKKSSWIKTHYVHFDFRTFLMPNQQRKCVRQKYATTAAIWWPLIQLSTQVRKALIVHPAIYLIFHQVYQNSKN